MSEEIQNEVYPPGWADEMFKWFEDHPEPPAQIKILKERKVWRDVFFHPIEIIHKHCYMDINGELHMPDPDVGSEKETISTVSVLATEDEEADVKKAVEMFIEHCNCSIGRATPLGSELRTEEVYEWVSNPEHKSWWKSYEDTFPKYLRDALDEILEEE
ncbi:MAG TPA: hypothetical protein P5288_08400 [Bacteroidales bacterium]|mgnify:CR=1 FL=1|jgi:hypothetical protein|nr:hypothetical protein [Bacteroidales bacterium]